MLECKEEEAARVSAQRPESVGKQRMCILVKEKNRPADVWCGEAVETEWKSECTQYLGGDKRKPSDTDGHWGGTGVDKHQERNTSFPFGYLPQHKVTSTDSPWPLCLSYFTTTNHKFFCCLDGEFVEKVYMCSSASSLPLSHRQLPLEAYRSMLSIPHFHRTGMLTVKENNPATTPNN